MSSSVSLPRSIVCLDIETTGLDRNADSIIEIAAIRFKGHRIEAEFQVLIDPGKRIPDNITTLTGIDNAMVRNAPRVQEVMPKLIEFCGDSPILGQNVQFDLGFINRYKALMFNDRLDTYDIASVLMPRAGRYNLAALGRALNIPLLNSHRAMDDVKLTHAVFMRLFEKIHELPIELVNEIVFHGETVSWPGTLAFKFAFANMAKETLEPTSTAMSRIKISFPEFDPRANVAIDPDENAMLPLDPEEVSAHLDHGGEFAKASKNFEHRPEQLAMAQAVSEALSNNYSLMVEAGTGVGKSFAYLVPAALFAIQNKARVIVSTNTINLQAQLIQKDIPLIRDILGIDVKATVLKGRSNYLCPRLFNNLRQNGPISEDEMRVLAKILVWSLSKPKGDRNEISLNRPGEREAWMKVSAEDDRCTNDTCSGKMHGACPFYNARQSAFGSHIVIVNHALLLSDVASGGKVLPEYKHLVIDEGHHLESAATDALAFRLSQYDFERLMKDVGSSNSGDLGFMLNVCNNYVQVTDYAALTQLVAQASEHNFKIETYAKDFFNLVSEYISSMQEGRGNPMYSFQARIIDATRRNQNWDSIEESWMNVESQIVLTLDRIEDIYKYLAELISKGYDQLEDTISRVSNDLRRVHEVSENISGMIHSPKNNTIYWVESNPQNFRITLNSAPLRIGPSLKEQIWDAKNSVILTSATLTTNGHYNYLKDTLMAHEAEEETLGSPFDYENSALLYLPTDVPEPNQPQYESAVNSAVLKTAIATGGRMLVLFTNNAQLRRCGNAIGTALHRQDIQVFIQGEGASPSSLLEEFMNSDRAVLLGTRSFWEGVDVPGKSLSVVMITRLPFEVPSDPIIAARSENFEDPFNEYQVPEAILKFRQGFGRLIRSKTDKGVVVILDRRILTKNYGGMFINSLPQCTVRKDSVMKLPETAARWINE